MLQNGFKLLQCQQLLINLSLFISYPFCFARFKVCFFIFGYFLPLLLIICLYSVMINRLLAQVFVYLYFCICLFVPTNLTPSSASIQA